MSTQYVAVGWSRRPDGGKMVRNSRRHLRISTHTGTGVRTVCGLLIHQKVLYAHLDGRDSIGDGRFAAVLSLSDDELAQEAACVRCYSRAGLAIVSADGREKLAQQIGADRGPRFTAALFEAEGLTRLDRRDTVGGR